ncbi:MAG: diguanylate cyclase [Nautiliaceae bacterium]
MLSDLTVLYVEDDKDARECMKMLLEEHVKCVYDAKDGVEGLEKYKKFSPDLVISDINMPRMNGLDMIEKIKEINEEQNILILSAYDDKEKLLRAIKIGVNDFIIKPINFDKLLNKIANIEKSLELKKCKLKEQEELYRKAHYDLLTKIPNKYLFELRLEEIMNKAKRENSSFAVFFIDLDNFKMVNDTCGHQEGDDVLYKVAQSIKSIIRREDLLARIGGDEFVLIIENIQKEDLKILAKKILQAARLDVKCQGRLIKVSCSIGIAIFPDDSDHKDILLALSDSAMYKAKEIKNSFYFASEKG